MTNSRSSAGGKTVTYRRKQRIAATPYDRPPPLKSPNWFSGVVVPSARAIASGAGKILSSIFSDSGSSSSEDEDYVSEGDDIVNDNFPEIPCNQENTLNEKNVVSPEMMQYRQESQLSVWKSETKKIIEQLIMKEIFSSEERDSLIKVLNSRVIDWSTEAGEKSSVAGSPGIKPNHGTENADILDRAVQEARKWFQEKKGGLSSATELAQGSSNLNPTTLEHVETGGGSPVDLARSYMQAMSPWTSPGRNIELKPPSTVSMKLFQEGTLYSAGRYSVSSSENRRSFASGSWDIQQELRRVRSRAAEDMVCSPSTKTDPSHLAVARIKIRTPGAGEEVFAEGERMIEPQSLRLHKPIDALIDAGLSSLAALKSRQDSKATEALSSKPHTSGSGNNEVPEAVQADAECSASKLIHPSSCKHARELHSDVQLNKFVGRESANGLSSSQVSLSRGVAEHEDQMARASNENMINVEGNCGLLSEDFMEVPIIMASGSLDVQYEERSLGITSVEKHGITGGKQQGRKTSKNYRRGRGRGK